MLEQQTQRIADALLRAGINVVLDNDVALIGAITGIVERQRVYRAVRFLPTVAGRDRRPMVNGMKLFMAGHKNAKHFRYGVMTCAEPMLAHGDLRGAIQKLSRRISKWSHRARKKFGVKVLFRGIEFTRKTAEERGMLDRYQPDAILYHLHANVVYWPTRNMGDNWPVFLRDTHSFMGAEWKDNGAIKTVEEIVKYCSKPTDTLAASDDELVWLYEHTKRLKICQPLGDFKEWLKGLEALGEKVVRVHLGSGVAKLMRVRKRRKPSKDPADQDAAQLDPTTDNKDVDANTIEARWSTPPTNVILGLTLPQWRHTPWAEPLIMVQHYDPTKGFGEGGIDIESWRGRARRDWDENDGPDPLEALRVARMALDANVSTDEIREAAEAAPYIVHTRGPTVPESPPEDEEVAPEELDDEIRALLSLFEGARIVRLAPPPRPEDDEIPFESPVREACHARLRADHARSWRTAA